MTADARVEDLLRELAPRVLGVLVRRSEDFAVCEDVVQDALVAAAQHWPTEGPPHPHLAYSFLHHAGRATAPAGSSTTWWSDVPGVADPRPAVL